MINPRSENFDVCRFLLQLEKCENSVGNRDLQLEHLRFIGDNVFFYETIKILFDESVDYGGITVPIPERVSPIVLPIDGRALLSNYTQLSSYLDRNYVDSDKASWMVIDFLNSLNPWLKYWFAKFFNRDPFPLTKDLISELHPEVIKPFDYQRNEVLLSKFLDEKVDLSVGDWVFEPANTNGDRAFCIWGKGSPTLRDCFGDKIPLDEEVERVLQELTRAGFNDYVVDGIFSDGIYFIYDIIPNDQWDKKSVNMTFGEAKTLISKLGRFDKHLGDGLFSSDLYPSLMFVAGEKVISIEEVRSKLLKSYGILKDLHSHYSFVNRNIFVV
jgi:hypothetical protein